MVDSSENNRVFHGYLLFIEELRDDGKKYTITQIQRKGFTFQKKEEENSM